MNNYNVQNFLENIASDSDIHSIFSDVDSLKKEGNGYKALCPFHDEKTPSFSITIKDSVILYHCFGCGESGNAIHYIEKAKGFDFKEAVKYLSELTGVPFEFKKRKKTKEEIEFENFHNYLLEDEKAKRHLFNRGINDLSIFGYDKEKEIYKILYKTSKKNYIISHDPTQTKIKKNNNFLKYDFPNGMDKTIPFGYGKKDKEIWITEGVFDSLNLKEHFGKNAVSILGSDINKNTYKYLRRYEYIILCLDNDLVGNANTLKYVKELYKNGFTKVFYVKYGDTFKHKDINDALQNENLEKVKETIEQVKEGYEFLLNNHLIEIRGCENDLEKVKVRDTFLNQILTYKDNISNAIIKEYQLLTHKDITNEYQHLKQQVQVKEFQEQVNEIVSNKDFSIKQVEELIQLANHTNTTTININYSNPSDIFSIMDLHEKKIKSELIEDIYYYAGALSFIGARTGHGKTTFMINECINLARNGVNNISFFSLEESKKYIIAKMIVNLNNKLDHSNNITLQEFFQRTGDFKQMVRNINNVTIVDSVYCIEDIEKYILYLHTHLDINIFFIDYVQRIGINDIKLNRLSRQEQIKQINTRLLNIAKQNDIYIILGSQFNREVKKKENIQNTYCYREAGDIEQDANLIINLWKEVEEDTGEVSLYSYVAKNRNGKSGFDKILCYDPEHWLIG